MHYTTWHINEHINSWFLAQLWPRGNYALPKAASGCPGGTNFTWKEGWVFQDLDDNGEIKTKSSSSFNMAADIDDYGNIKRWFCSKNVTKDEDNKRPLWPNGILIWNVWIYILNTDSTITSKDGVCMGRAGGRIISDHYESTHH